ncbi:MAG: hypothetical protein Ct9H300mP32_3320 [Verrucomicrobiota bacterium]|nr:MAG: hypothetical protein Ct9H300mP32_3320 [Verrucomicrobiota bacterium]
MPNAIYRHTRNKRVTRVDHPLGQTKPTAAALGPVSRPNASRKERGTSS